MTESTTTSLIPLPDKTAIEAFKTPGGLEPLLVAIEAECRAQPVVLNTENGRKNIKTLNHKVATTKTTIESIGKKLQEPFQAEIDLILAGRKVAWARLETLQKEILKPLNDWEAEEKARIAGHETAVKELEGRAVFEPETIPTSADIEARIVAVNEMAARPWEEYSSRHVRIRGEVLDKLEAALAAAKAREAEEAAHAAWLAMLAEADQENHEFNITRAAAKAARELAEAQAQVEIIWAEAHRENAEFDQRIAEAQAEHNRWQTIYAEAEAENRDFDQRAREESTRVAGQREALVRLSRIGAFFQTYNLSSAALRARIAEAYNLFSERDWQEFKVEAKSVYDEAVTALISQIQVAEAEELARATKTADAALAAAKAEQYVAEAKRKEDESHRGKVNGEATDAIADILSGLSEGGSEEPQDWAFEIVTAISKGLIPHVSIKY